jgi:hypothetical protein
VIISAESKALNSCLDKPSPFVCGMALGHIDPDGLVTERVPLADYASFDGL